MYFVENFSEDFLFVYTQCFSNMQWVKDYGLDPTDFCISDFIKNSVLTSNKNVERLIIMDNNRNAIGFAHLCFDKNNCVVVGGVLPNFQKTGKGIYTAVIVYDYLFQQKKDIEIITIKVLKTNQASLKMNLKIGFSKVNEFNYNTEEKFTLNLEKSNYPNDFSSSILSRLKHEIQ